MAERGGAPGHLVEVERVRKSFGNNLVLDGIDLTIDRGEVRFDGRSLARAGKDLNRIRAEIGMVFQQFNLFAHRTVMDNLTMAPVEVKGLSSSEARDKAERLLERVGMTEKADAFPADLSGGQQQRVAIARALAMEPKLMLFDEPTSALDPEMIREVLDVMRDLARDGMTMAVVTHEMGFAREVGDRIVFIDGGQIVEQAPPGEFFAAAKSERARDFVDKIIHH